MKEDDLYEMLFLEELECFIDHDILYEKQLSKILLFKKFVSLDYIENEEEKAELFFLFKRFQKKIENSHVGSEEYNPNLIKGIED